MHLRDSLLRHFLSLNSLLHLNLEGALGRLFIFMDINYKESFQFMKDDLSDKSRIFMTIAIISIYVFPSFLAVLLMALVLSLYFKSYSSVVLLVCTFLSSVIYYSSSVFDFSWQNKVLGYSIIFASLTGLLFFILSKR